MTSLHGGQDALGLIEMFRRWASNIADRPFDEVDASTHLVSLGLDSIALIELVAELEDELNVSFCDAHLEAVRTLGELEELVLSCRRKRDDGELSN